MPATILQVRRDQIPGEPSVLPPRTFGAYSFLYAYFLDSGIQGKRALAFVEGNGLEFVRPGYDLFLLFLLPTGELGWCTADNFKIPVDRTVRRRLRSPRGLSSSPARNGVRALPGTLLAASFFKVSSGTPNQSLSKIS